MNDTLFVHLFLTVRIDSNRPRKYVVKGLRDLAGKHYDTGKARGSS